MRKPCSPLHMCLMIGPRAAGCDMPASTFTLDSVQTGWIIYMYATEPNVGALRLTPTDSFTDPIVQFVSLFHRSLKRIPGI